MFFGNALFGTLLNFVESIDTRAGFVTTSLWLTAHPVEFGAIEILGTSSFGIKISNTSLAFFEVVTIVAFVVE